MTPLRFALVGLAGVALLAGAKALPVHAETTGSDLANDINVSVQAGELASTNDVDTAAEQDVDNGAIEDIAVNDETDDTVDSGETPEATPEATSEATETAESATSTSTSSESTDSSSDDASAAKP